MSREEYREYGLTDVQVANKSFAYYVPIVETLERHKVDLFQSENSDAQS